MSASRITAAALLAFAAALAAVVLLLTTPWPATPSSGSDVIQGDVDCDDDVDAVDALFDLRFVAGIGPFAGCTERAGDTDCSGNIGATDGLHILRFVAGFASTTPEDCTQIGTPLGEPPTPSTGSTGTPTPTPTGTPVTYALTRVLDEANFDSMIDFDVIPGTSGQEAAVITQDGFLWRISLTGAFPPKEFGDISGLVLCCGEDGLLSIAFSPDFVDDDRVYLYYTRSNQPGNNCSGPHEQCSFVSRFTVSDGQIAAGPFEVLEVDQHQRNHNGGKLLFGREEPNPYLYVSLGDGGGAFDTGDNGQNKDTLLGTVIRIDVSGPSAYTIPNDNPFVGQAGADEIWAYGLRNPWRMSFDRETGDLWAGDVGQDDWEEVDLIVEGGNYGWVCYEGNVEENMGAPGCPPSGPVQFPRAVYANPGPDPLGDCAVVGGYVYRGSELPELDGWYIFGDNCSGRVRAFDTESDDAPIILIESGLFTSSFAELPNGELLVLTYENAIFQLVQN